MVLEHFGQGNLTFLPDCFTPDESSRMLATLLREIEWKQEPIRLFGRLVMQPRLTAWYGDPGVGYRYSGIKLRATGWTPTLLEIKNRIEPVAGARFNSVLLNQYRDGRDSMGWHRDNEKELGLNPIIGSVSFGATRIFQLRRYVGKNQKTSIPLTSGSLLIMKGDLQEGWEHCIPKVGKKTQPPIGARINLTFRAI